MNKKQKIVVSVSGASGAIYAKVLFDRLQRLHNQVEEVGILIDGKTYDTYGFEDIQKNDFHKFDVGAKLAAGVKLKPQLTIFWELSNSIPFFPIQDHPGKATYGLNKGKYNSILSFSFRYLFSE